LQRVDIFLGEYQYTHNCRTVTYAFGQVASTGQYKVLRISHLDRSQVQPLRWDIIAFDGSSHGSWRRKQNTPVGLMRRIYTMNCFALNGVVYFFFNYTVMGPGSIAPFDLGTEERMLAIRGPEPLRSVVFRDHRRTLSSASLNGSLVAINNVIGVSFDLWFLMDHEQSLWVKKYSLSIQEHCEFSYPLLVLDDERIVIFERINRVLQCYDPTTGNLTNVLDMMDMGIGVSQSIGVYTGSLLI
jgi:F-box interacting protein